MNFQKQTKVHAPERGITGNCMMACYCSYLDIPLEQAPAIELLFPCEKPSDFWMRALDLWLKCHGYREEYVVVLPESDNGHTEPFKTMGVTDYYFAIGPSARGVHHMVIYKDGEMVFDPHPSNAGLLSVEQYCIMRPLEALPPFAK